MNSVLSSLTWGTWDESSWDNPSSINKSTSLLACNETSESEKHSKSRKKRHRKLQRRTLQTSANPIAWFEEILSIIMASQFGRLHVKYDCNPLQCLHHNVLSSGSNNTLKIAWDSLPSGLHPKHGNLKGLRAERKLHQVENLAHFLQGLLKPGYRVVEFCAGSGYVVLPLAYLFPQCEFVLLDMKRPSLAIAQARINAAKLKNVEIFCGMIDDYYANFDVGIALHACGDATDMALEKCLHARAAYVVAPCCVGKIQLSKLEYPRSRAMQEVVTLEQYKVLAKAADFGHSDSSDFKSQRNCDRRRCKTIIECDRSMRSKERGYQTMMFIMHPKNCTPKNDIIVGLPSMVTPKFDISLPCNNGLSSQEFNTLLFS